jgi:hypothetical protein
MSRRTYFAAGLPGIAGRGARALRNGEPYELDLKLQSWTAASRWIRERGEVIRNEKCRIARLRKAAQDLTEEKRAEEALRASAERFRLAP